MSGRPVLQSSFEYHMWKVLDARAYPNGGPLALVSELDGYEGTVNSQVLVMLVDELSASGDVDRDIMRRVVSKSRATDCRPSIRACEALVKKGDLKAAEEVLDMSEGSQEMVGRSLALARIRMAAGDRAGAMEAAGRAYGYDPSCRGAYQILAETDPEGGWLQRENIQSVLEGGRPSRPPAVGRIQELYSIYYDWFTGHRDAATEGLVASPYYKEKDPEFLLASARMSMDEKDWRSALMVYSELIAMEAPPFVFVEAAEASLGAGDASRALDWLGRTDGNIVRVQRDMVRANMLAGDRAGMMDSIRILLDNETSGSDEYVRAVRFLIGRGMEREAASILDRYSRFVGDDPDTLTMRSVMLMRSGDYLGAHRAASKAVALDKNNNAARAQLARMLFLMDKTEAAERECAGILSRDPSDFDALSLMKDLQMSERDYVKAEATCRRILETVPDDIPAMMALAVSVCYNGDPSRADGMFRDVLKVDGSRERAVSVVSAMVSCGMNREAESMCTQLERQYPKEPLIKRLKGNAQYALGDYLKASVSFSEAASLEPHNPVLWYSKGMADESRGDLESAEDAYNRAVLLDQGEAEYWIAKASVQEKSKDRYGAVESLNRAIELDPSSVYPLIRKAVILSEHSKVKEALFFVRMASSIDPDDVRIMDMEADLLTSLGEVDDAEAVLTRRTSLESDEDAWLRLARVRLSKGDRDGAVAAIDSGLSAFPGSDRLMEERGRVSSGSIGPKVAVEVKDEPTPEPEAKEPEIDPEACRAMAVSLLNAGNLKGAMREVDRALNASPEDPDLYCLKARIALAGGDADGASFLVGNALRIQPNHAGLRQVNALAREAKGDLKGALSEIDNAIAGGLDDAESNRIKGRILEKSGYPERAASSYAKALSLDPEDLDTAEAQARQQIASGNLSGAFGTVNWILRRDARRVSVIVMKAEIGRDRNDGECVLSACDELTACPEIPEDAKVRMARILEEMDLRDEARALMGGARKSQGYDDAVKRYAEKALRRAYTTRTSAYDPDILDALGLEPAVASQVSKYLSDIPEAGPINPNDPEFDYMERLSHDTIMKMKWTDLEVHPTLPLEKVFVAGGFRDADSAKMLVAYVKRAMLTSPRTSDDRLSSMAMGLIKGMSVYEIMRQCDLGVYEANAVKALIV